MKQRSPRQQLNRDIAQLQRRVKRLKIALLELRLAKGSRPWKPWEDSEQALSDAVKQLARLQLLRRMERKRDGMAS